MHTIITQEVDGYEVVTDVSTLQINLELTKPLVNGFMAESQVHKDIEAKKKEIMNHAKAGAEAKQHAANAKKNGKTSEFERHSADFRFREEKIKEIMLELKPISEKYIKQQREATLKLAVYHQPKPGEKTVENGDTVLKELRDALANDELLCADGSRIKDYRGKRYFKKSGGQWLVQEISKLGEEPMDGGKENLTEDELKELQEQVDSERISKLSDADKEREKQIMIDGAAAQAATMRSKLEIQDEKQSLKKSQEWYKTEVAKIEKKYGA